MPTGDCKHDLAPKEQTILSVEQRRTKDHSLSKIGKRKIIHIFKTDVSQRLDTIFTFVPQHCIVLNDSSNLKDFECVKFKGASLMC